MNSRGMFGLSVMVFAIGASAAEIRGVVTGPKGPEAGVWVIAETTDLPTKFAKVVVTDDRGRYLIPELPQANYSVWVRGYGLVDSGKVKSAAGKTLNLKAVAAPSAKAAAEYYPGMYWYSLLKIPDKSEFPGTGDKGNGISENIKTQEQWVDTVKNACQSCHALGSKGIRTVPKLFQESSNSFQAWARRTQAGQAMTNMATGLGYMGAEAALKRFADWTDRVAGGELPWDGHASIHGPMMDREGRGWFTSAIRPAAAQPAYCSDGSLPSSKVAPLKESPRHLSIHDPNTNTWTLSSTCFATHHLYFASKDPNYTLWTSAGGPGGGVVGWLNTKKYFETGDEAASQGWTPIVVDTNGNGVRDDSDTRLRAAFYGVTPSTVDDSVWGQSMGIGFARMNQPGYLMRIVPGPNPAETALTEVYVPPEGAYSPRGIDMGTDGVVWTPLASGHIASFDRRKCKGPLNGPEAASGKLCPEGWTLYRMTGPQFKGLDPSGSANHAYYIWVDRYNTFGLGANVPIAETNGSESLMAVVDGKIIDFRVPYPLGFFTKNVDGRIDDPQAGWKGRAMWTTSGTRTNFHNEGGTDNRPKVYKLQLRPDPLAR